MSPAPAVHHRLGLRRHPFPPTPDPAAYYYTNRLECEVAELEHCIDTRKGIMVVTGEVGLGKSTLLRRLLETRSRGRTVFALVFNTFLRGPELLAAICSDFGLTPGESVSTDLARLNQFLIEQRRQGRNCVLLVDDAQNLDSSSLELIRLLSNLETGQDKLLQIVLCGQPELEDALAAESLRQLRSRVVKRVHLTPLSRARIPHYVAFRINAAGGSRLTLRRGAAGALYRASRGNPRRLHLILDRCLYGLVGQGRREIDGRLVRQAAAELGFLPRRRVAAPVAAAATFVGAGLVAVAFTPDGAQWPDRLAGWWRAHAPAVATPPGSSTPSNEGAVPAPVESGPTPASDRGLEAQSDLPAVAGIAPMVPPLSDPVPGGTVARADPDGGSPAACLARLRALHGADGIRLRAMPPALARAVAGADGRAVCTVTLDGMRWAALPALPSLEEGALVRHVQSSLMEAGLLARDEVDGVMGPVTRRALRAYQRRASLPVTGELDALTVLALRELDGRVLVSRGE